MDPTPATNTPTEPEAEPTMRALDLFFETSDMRDHANRWDVSALWATREAQSVNSETVNSHQ